MDIYDTILICDNCNKQTEKSYVERDGFKIRTWSCPNCDKEWNHPSDMEEYKKFNQIKDKDFTVKLRQVGNSYAVSIPKEIIQFTEVTKEGRLVRMSMEGPEKVSISFTKTIRKIVRRHPQ
mgnify:FL=1